jgi:hypothetical protein
MTGKKPGKDTKHSSTTTQPAAAAKPAVDAKAALLAVSTPATPDDTKKAAIYACVVSTFAAQGLNPINNEQAKIVWTTIDDDVIVLLGDGVTHCIDSKGFTCTPLAPAFQNLKNMGQVTVVSDLVSGIAVVVTP